MFGITPTDEPLVFTEASTPYGAEVVDLDGMRIRFGRPKPVNRVECRHSSLIYNTGERRVWCADCERPIDSFDAFMVVTDAFQGMARKARRNFEKSEEALAMTLVRRAAKAIDKAWHKYAVSCPHCCAGLLPEDFESGCDTCSRDLELARRKKAAE